MMKCPTDHTVAHQVSTQVAQSAVTAAFRDALILEIVRLARPIIEAPFLEHLEKLRSDVEESDDEVGKLIDEAISALRGSSDVRP